MLLDQLDVFDRDFRRRKILVNRAHPGNPLESDALVFWARDRDGVVTWLLRKRAGRGRFLPFFREARELRVPETDNSTDGNCPQERARRTSIPAV
jgi:hypothetical protein